MATPAGDAATRIALRAQEMKLLFLGLNLAIPVILHPDAPILGWTLQLTGTAPDADVPVIVAGRTGEQRVSFSAREILTKITALRGEVVSHDILSMAMLLGATRLGDMILQARPSRPGEPLLQFARHFRNAAAHGDRWSFHQGGPKYPAICRDLVLTAEMDGRRATWETVTPKTYVDFLDDLSNHFVPGLVPSPGASARNAGDGCRGEPPPT